MKNEKIITITKNQATLAKRDALRKFSLNLNVRRFTTDSNGIILDDATVPAAQQKAYAFHLFGEFDRQSGYAIADLIAQERNNSILFAVYVWGISTPLFFFNPLATINAKFKKGDLVFVYVDDVNNPSYFHFVIVSAQQGGYASMVSQSNISQIDDIGHWGVFQFTDFKYTWIDDAQLMQPIYFVKTRFNSAYKSDAIDPGAYQFVENKRAVKQVVIPVEIVLNQYIGLTSFIAWENSVLNLSFNLYL